MMFDNQLKMVHHTGYNKMEHHLTMLQWFVVIRQTLRHFFVIGELDRKDAKVFSF